MLRYLKDSIENEGEHSWNKQMRSLIQEMIHYRNQLPQEAASDAGKIKEFEERYRTVLKKAKLLFLHDHRVPATNNESERLLRRYKRKQQQAVSFRGYESIEYLCQCMSMLIQIRQKEGANIFHRVSRIFG